MQRQKLKTDGLKALWVENNLKGHFKVAVVEDMAKGRDVVKSSYIFVPNTR